MMGEVSEYGDWLRVRGVDRWDRGCSDFGRKLESLNGVVGKSLSSKKRGEISGYDVSNILVEDSRGESGDGKRKGAEKRKSKEKRRIDRGYFRRAKKEVQKTRRWVRKSGSPRERSQVAEMEKDSGKKKSMNDEEGQEDIRLLKRQAFQVDMDCVAFVPVLESGSQSRLSQ
ncbi:hypothetical protein ACH5RR_015067 [Cinchona calisaya]|uniref:Uncharacterized protein n=1 Tax=Cinchona calisaya TaxID=153742 RepID=A0ABD2ZT99_9GENT